MQIQEEKFNKRRVQTSYVSVVVSISLVLFMLGLVGLIVLHANKLSNHVKENISVSVFLFNDAKDAEVKRFQKELDASIYVKSTEFINKDQAAKQLQNELGEDFIDFLGYNPLLASIDVYLNAQYAHPDSVRWIEEELRKNTLVKDVNYQASLLEAINKNVKRISAFLMGFSLLLFVIAFALINNSIRLSIYSKRFLIRSMQLVGATESFIRKPFIIRGVLNGIYGAILANALLVVVLYYAKESIPALFEFKDTQLFLALFGMVLLTGVLITFLSTRIAVGKYLKLRSDKLY